MELLRLNGGAEMKYLIILVLVLGLGGIGYGEEKLDKLSKWESIINESKNTINRENKKIAEYKNEQYRLIENSTKYNIVLGGKFYYNLEKEILSWNEMPNSIFVPGHHVYKKDSYCETSLTWYPNLYLDEYNYNNLPPKIKNRFKKWKTK